MRVLLLCAAIAAVTSGQARAAELQLNISNVSGEALVAISAASKTAAGQEVLFTATVASGETADITVNSADDNCIFDLKFTFASARTMTLTDTDICQTDAIVVE